MAKNVSSVTSEGESLTTRSAPSRSHSDSAGDAKDKVDSETVTSVPSHS